MKVVINICNGGFGLSLTAQERYLELKGESSSLQDNDCDKDRFYDKGVKRNDPFLVQVVEELGDKSFGCCAELKIVEIPDDVDWYIEEYDGNEWVSEAHRTWS